MRLDKRRIKLFLLKIIGYSMHFSGVYFLLDKLFRNKGIYILMYHKIAEKEDNCYYQDIAVKKEEFIRQLKYFSQKYCCISMSEAVSIISSGKALNKDYMVFTFDDGYLDNLKNGMDIFKQYNIKPIVYLTANKIETKEPIWTEAVDYIILNSDKESIEIDIFGKKIMGKTDNKKSFAYLTEKIKEILIKMPQESIRIFLDGMAKKLSVSTEDIKNELLSWNNIKELMGAGWEAGSHTMNHINMAVENGDIVMDELSASRELIKTRLGFRVEDFAYPFGQNSHYNNFAVEAVKKYYRSAVTTMEGINQCGDDLYHLRRIMIANHHSLMNIRVKLLKVKIMEYFRRKRVVN